MLKVTTHNIMQIIVEEMMNWNVAPRRKTYQRLMAALSDRLIRYFAVAIGGAGLEPTTNHVSEIIITEMQRWNPRALESERQLDLVALADRLISYFVAFHAHPVQLDGLPGGHPINTPRL